MTDEQKQEALAIAEKYHHKYSEFTENATANELTTLLQYVAQEANRKQREVAGLE